jgi:hypothetical protein
VTTAREPDHIARHKIRAEVRMLGRGKMLALARRTVTAQERKTLAVVGGA